MNLEEIFSQKLTENGDIAFDKASSDVLLNTLFLTEYYQKHLDEVPHLMATPLNRLFAMFIRDPRFGLGRRDLGRVLMSYTKCSIEQIVKAGRVDDLFHCTLPLGEDVLNSVRALKESNSTKEYFKDDSPFDDSVEHLYQLKFKTVLDGVPYRCMSDLLIVDYKSKTVQPIDLKTSSHTEWDFFKSFIQWNYQIQARLYWRIRRAGLVEKSNPCRK